MFFIWLFLYGAVSFLSRYLSRWTPWATPLGLLISTATLMIWLLAKGKGASLGLQRAQSLPWKKRLPFLLLLLPVGYNLLCANFSFPALLSIFTICLAVILEEVVFRGVLLHFLRRKGDLFAIIASTALFALAHIFNQGGIDWYQILFALAAGFAFSGLTLVCGSIFPAMDMHLLINLTAGDMNQSYLWLFFVCIAAYLFCGIHSIILLSKTSSSEKG